MIQKPKEIKTLFHFGEFARIYQSFIKIDDCVKSNSVGSNAIFNFCLNNKIKLIYSATSATLGNKGEDKNLFLCFFKIYKFRKVGKFKKTFIWNEVVYFYNVYGPHQICKGDMSTVIGIFEDHYKKKKLYQSLNLEHRQEDYAYR